MYLLHPVRDYRQSNVQSPYELCIRSSLRTQRSFHARILVSREVEKKLGVVSNVVSDQLAVMSVQNVHKVCIALIKSCLPGLLQTTKQAYIWLSNVVV